MDLDYADEDDDFDSDSIVINERDGLPDVHPIAADIADDLDIGSLSVVSSRKEPDVNVAANESLLKNVIIDELPKSLIVTNIDESVFYDDREKHDIESLFCKIDPDVSFVWLKSFRRLRVSYKTVQSAVLAKINLHERKTNRSVINCYFAQQQVTPIRSSLQIPAPYKQFLISPPASPPANWKPRPESEPLINNDLIAAIASLDPGNSLHEIHPSSSDKNYPRIILQTAEKNNQND